MESLIEKLELFGLAEKEATLYLKLLNYGAKTVGELAKSCDTYRLDVQRIIESLFEKGMIEESTEKPTKYSAVAVEDALDAAVTKHAYELRLMQHSREEIAGLIKSQTIDELDDFYTFKIIKGTHEIIAASARLVDEANEDITFICDSAVLSIKERAGLLNNYKEAAQRDVSVRGITSVSPMNLSLALDISKDVQLRHCDDYAGISFLVIDKRQSVTWMSYNAMSYAFSSKAGRNAVIWCDRPDYAEHLIGVFDIIWAQSSDSVKQTRAMLSEFEVA
ncbi:MAG: hypothetical protein LUP95_06815 [Euryarchaeota archaeon]|nr:hypothetical protein [Euryarchaeota archaeon]